MMKTMRMQIRRSQLLLTFGVAVSELRQKLSIPRDVQGAVVLDLQAYSAAAQAGLRPGDVILSINRKEVKNPGEASTLTQNVKEKRALLRVWSSSGSHSSS